MIGARIKVRMGALLFVFEFIYFLFLGVLDSQFIQSIGRAGHNLENGIQYQNRSGELPRTEATTSVL
jgi:hypothetical protein